MKQETITISTALGQALVDYLAGRPYREVVHLIAGLQQSASATNGAPDEHGEPEAKQ